MYSAFYNPPKKSIPDTPTIVRWLVYPYSSQVEPVDDAFQNAAPPSGIDDLSKFWLSCLGPLVFVLTKLLNYLAFQSFDFECTWWRLFQKHVVGTKFDIKVFITLHTNSFARHNNDKTDLLTFITCRTNKWCHITITCIRIPLLDTSTIIMTGIRFTTTTGTCNKIIQKSYLSLLHHQ